MSRPPRFLDEPVPQAERGSPQPCAPEPGTPEPEASAREAGFRPPRLFADEDMGAPRTAFTAVARVAAAPRRRSSLSWAALGGGCLLLTALLLGLDASVEDAFRRSHVAGLLGVAGMLAGLAALLGATIAEWRSWRRLAAVPALRTLLADPGLPIARQREAASRWVVGCGRAIRGGESLAAALRGARDLAELRALLARDACAPLAERARRAGTRAAIETGAAVAIVPSPVFDGLIAAWRGLRLMREIATSFGLRPGPLATLALARQVAGTAAGLAGLGYLSQAVAVHALKELPLLGRMAEALPGVGLAALRLQRLAAVTAEACSPLAGIAAPAEENRARGESQT